MFRPQRMQRVHLQVLREDAPKAALLLADCGVFDPQPDKGVDAQLPELLSVRYRELYESAHTRLEKLCEAYHLAPEAGEPELRVIQESELAQADDRLGELWRAASDTQEGLRRLEDQRRELEQLLETLQKFSALDVDLGHLQRRKRFLDVRVGTVPEANLPRLTQAVSLAGYVITVFLVSAGTAYVVVAGPSAQQEGELNQVLEAAGFRAVNIPEEFTDHPTEVARDLRQRLQEIITQRQTMQAGLQRAARESEVELQALHGVLVLAAPYARLADVLRGRGGLALFSGWVPSQQLLRLQLKLEEGLVHPFVLHARDPFPEESEQVPSTISHHRWLWPFVQLVRNYGVPGYNEFDPTLLFTVSFLVMFGMMFGDLGQGAMIAVAGLLLPRRWRRLRPAFLSAGISSMLFGWLYGSVFGGRALAGTVVDCAALRSAAHVGRGLLLRCRLYSAGDADHHRQPGGAGDVARCPVRRSGSGGGGDLPGRSLRWQPLVSPAAAARLARAAGADSPGGGDGLLRLSQSGGLRRTSAGGGDGGVRDAARLRRQYALFFAPRRLQSQSRRVGGGGLHPGGHDGRSGVLDYRGDRQRRHHGAGRGYRGDPGIAPGVLRGILTVLYRDGARVSTVAAGANDGAEDAVEAARTAFSLITRARKG
ncbi:MAG: hypothetical protein HND59_00310 [Pseudomonadota bacterium]|nr:MAG: hypothetical protein HND59_00310 [Pseudomonadota bacterium]